MLLGSITGGGICENLKSFVPQDPDPISCTAPGASDNKQGRDMEHTARLPGGCLSEQNILSHTDTIKQPGLDVPTQKG